jgi:uncharacterized protein YndB with AHSA1/START domain
MPAKPGKSEPRDPKRDKSVSLSRYFEASAERVFDAWINPEVAGKWLFTMPISEAHTTEIDARVGGKYTITDTREGTQYTAIGEYLEVDRPHRLVFTFGMPQFSPEFDRITVEIVPEGTGCVMTLKQEDMLSGYEKSTKRGWSKMIKELAKLVEGRLG